MNSSWLFPLGLAVLLLSAAGALADDISGSPATDKTVLQAAAALYEGIRTETLPNGLQVYLKPIPGAPLVTTMLAYRVGSADEDLDHTGLSHYLEHLMFKGTDKIMPGDIDRLTGATVEPTTPILPRTAPSITSTSPPIAGRWSCPSRRTECASSH